MTYEFRADAPPFSADRELAHYLDRTGGRPRDAYGQFRLGLLREMLSVLEAVMQDERVPPAVQQRVLRGVIYGNRPHASDEATRIHERVVQLEGGLAAASSPRPCTRDYGETTA